MGVEAASFVRSATGTKLATAGSPTVVTATLGSAATAGNMLIAVVGANGAATITGPAGWSTAINQSGTASQGIFYTIAAGGETLVSASVNANPGSIGIHVYEYSGATTFMSASSASGNSNTPTSGSVTTTASDELVFASFTMHKDVTVTAGTWSDADGFAERNYFQTTGGGAAPDAAYAGGDKLSSAAGTHSVTIGISAVAQWRGQIVRFQSDTTAPTVSNVTSSLADGTYPAGQVVQVQVSFSEVVTVTGTPQLTLATGSPATTAVNYVGGSGSTTLQFDYTVASGNVASDLDYASTSALALNGGTIKDAAGNAATLTFASPGASGSLGANKAIVIDGVAPSVSNVTSSLADGTYPAGQVVPIQVSFSEVVTVTGTPQLTLATGSPATTAVNYVSGTGSTTLRFDYTVTSGNVTSDLDYASTGALALNSGTIKDAAGNAATLTLASPGASGSLGANKAIAVDTAAPSVALTSSAPDPTASSPISMTATFSEAVSGLEVGEITVTNGSATNLVPVSGSVYTFDVSPAGQGTVTATIPAARAQDAAGNQNTVSNTLSRDFDSVAPSLTITSAVSSPTDESDILFTATFSEEVEEFELADIEKSSATVGDFEIVSESVYRFRVYPIGVPGSEVTVSIWVPADRAQDGAGNDNTASNGGATYDFIFDGHVPTVALTSSVTAPDTNDSPIPVTATFDEEVSDFEVGDLEIMNGSADAFEALSASIYTFEITPDGQGEVEVTVPAGAAHDVVPHYNLESNTLSWDYDTVEPTVSLDTVASDPTRVSPIPVTATFSEEVTGFALNDITVSGGSATNLDGSDADYSFDVIPSGQGLVTVSIAASKVQDDAGNPNEASGDLSRSYDSVEPILVQVTPVAVYVSDTTPTYVFSSTEAGTISYAGSCDSATSEAVSGSNAITFGALSQGLHNDCAVRVTDGAGNASIWLVADAFTVDVTPPAAISDLSTASPGRSSVTLAWTAPADALGAVVSYDIRYATAPILSNGDFVAAAQVSGEPAPASPGMTQAMSVTGLAANTTYYFAMKSSDQAANLSALSNIANARTIKGVGLGEAPASPADLTFSMTASPLTLPSGGGTVTFTYVVKNDGPQHIGDIGVRGDLGTLPCAPAYLSGDDDQDRLLDPGASWTYSCTASVSMSGTHVAQASGFLNSGRVSSDTATVVVLVGDVSSSANFHFHVRPFPEVLHPGGGISTLQYHVGNLGETPLSDIRFSGDFCKLSDLIVGDTDHDGLIDQSEHWVWTCEGAFTQTTSLEITLSARAGDVELVDVAKAQISVGAAEPRPSIHLHVTANPARLPAGGGRTILNYHVYNDGSLPLSEIVLESGFQTCTVPAFVGGDVAGDGVLGVTETWTYQCIEDLTDSKAAAAVARARSGEYQVYDDALIVVPVAVIQPSEIDEFADGRYDATAAAVASPDIDTSLGLERAATPTGCVAGVPYKLPSDGNPLTQEDSTIYYCGRDGRRHPFPNASVFHSWFTGFSNVVIMDRASLDVIPLGDAVTYRPGVRMVKKTTGPEVYAVARHGLLRWIETEMLAAVLYGADWRLLVDDLADSFWKDYTIGPSIGTDDLP